MLLMDHDLEKHDFIDLEFSLNIIIADTGHQWGILLRVWLTP